MKKIIQIFSIFLALFICSNNLFAQIVGKITDPKGEPLIGVNISVAGTNTGTISDENGAYRIDAKQGKLVFSYVGYKTMEMNVDNRSTIDVIMEEDVALLDQVVVVGYGSVKKKEITTAVVLVDEKDIKNRPMVSAAEALQGKAAGVQVTQPSGKPGGDIAVRVRGSTSVLAGNEPLYVVDGLPTTDIRGLNPADISSMTVLKDAASSSIYGARAANGVVLITTKRGKNNTGIITFNTYVGFSNIRKTLDVLNTDQYRALIAEIPSVGTFDPAIITNTKWSDLVFGTGKNQSYQLGFSGGGDKSSYLISANYLTNEGVVAPAKYNRISLRLNLDNQIKSWLKIGANVNMLSAITKDAQDNASSGRGGIIMSALNTPPFLKPYTSDGKTFAPNPFQPSWENPIAYMFGPDQKTTDNRILGNFNINTTLTKDLLLKSNFGIDINSNQWNYYLDPYRTSYGRVNNGISNSSKFHSTSYLIENTLNYSKNIDTNHNLNLLIGNSIQRYQDDNTYIPGRDLPSDTNITTNNAANDVTGSSSNRSEWALTSFFGRATYDFMSKYFITASVRRDGSSKLANPWGTMPSVSAAWRISQEPFFKNLTGINELKLRAGWGINGNQDGISSYARYGLVSYYRRQTTSPLSGPASYQATYGNPDLKWETTTQSNIGADISFFNSRVNASIDAYLKKTKDVLLNVQLPTSLPITSIQTNAGNIENKGIELNISTLNVTGGKLDWRTDFNISFNKNKVTALKFTDIYYYGRIYSNTQDVAIVKAGLPLGTFFGYVSEGVDPETGNLKYKDVNNNGIHDPGDRTVIGNAQPDFVYGLTNTLSYANFDLSIFFQGSQGNDIFNATRIDLEGMFDSKNQSTAVLRRWTTTNKNTDIPRANNIDNIKNSSRFVEDGSYLRLKSVTLSYNLPKMILSKIKFSRLSVYATGQNLLTFTKYSGFDPEVNAFGRSATELGIDYGTYPQSRTITFGINAEF